MFAVQAWKTRRFWRRSGAGNSILRSRRPGRRSAGSSVSARFVAMMTLTFVDWSKPSIWLRSSSRIRWTSRSAPVCASKRFVAMASISSMKMMQGAFFFASPKRLRMRDAPTPTNISTNSEPDVEMKGTPASPATARANSVLPVPGGPMRRQPLGSLPPRRVKRVGSLRNMTISSSSCLASSTPMTSENRLSLFSAVCTAVDAAPRRLDMPRSSMSAPKALNAMKATASTRSVRQSCWRQPAWTTATCTGFAAVPAAPSAAAAPTGGTKDVDAPAKAPPRPWAPRRRRAARRGAPSPRPWPARTAP
mmetsp:Transcript_15156/g.52516  ORF Transcript_15156/g.52516 Transcript_15156/m.52516 type:complete len:306 (-) Transcript_15156:357-1274(-)